ncbi:hypothetical protein LTS18_009428, partial [Coniosporium uncinatum]
MDLLVVTSPQGTAGVYANATPVALECILSWCVKRINASSVSGNYHEEVLQTFYPNPDIPYPWTINYTAKPIPTARYTAEVSIAPDPPLVQGESFGMDAPSALLAMLTLIQNMVPSYWTALNDTDQAQDIRYHNSGFPIAPA